MRCPVEWPPRSPDLTSCDYWLWLYLRSLVYNPPGCKFSNLFTLGRKIEEEMSKIPLKMFRRSVTDFRKRIREYMEANGGLFDDFDH